MGTRTSLAPALTAVCASALLAPATTQEVAPLSPARQVAKLTSGTPSALAGLGRVLAQDGDTLALAAPRGVGLVGSGSGEVALFERVPRGGWSRVASFALPGDSGRSLALRGDDLAVAEPEFGFLDSCVRLFHRDAGGPSSWGLVQTIPAPPCALPCGGTTRAFGWAMAFAGDRLLVGDPELVIPPGTAGPGLVYSYEREDVGSPWQLVRVVESPDPKPSGGFGVALAADGDLLAVADAVHVHVFELGQGGPGVYGAIGRVDNPFNLQSVALQGDLLFLGATTTIGGVSGRALLHRRDAGGRNEWGLVATLESDDQSEGFGKSVALEGELAFVGVPGGAAPLGRVEVFRRVAGKDRWEPALVLPDPDPVASTGFGNALAVSGADLFVGDPGDDQAASEAGAGQVFRLRPSRLAATTREDGR